MMIEDVSRETISRLELYKDLLIKWQRRYNLISPKSIDVLWERHFEDSLQLLRYISYECNTIVDLGSGAGLPGMVLAIAATHRPQVTLIESDTNKCIFLENVSRETKVDVKIINGRIESAKNIRGDLIVARGLASLSKLFEYSEPLIKKNATLLFLKGERFENEVQEAKIKWNFDLEIFSSLTDSTGRILKIKNLQRDSIND